MFELRLPNHSGRSLPSTAMPAHAPSQTLPYRVSLRAQIYDIPAYS
jgi:hypothetical protein